MFPFLPFAEFRNNHLDAYHSHPPSKKRDIAVYRCTLLSNDSCRVHHVRLMELVACRLNHEAEDMSSGDFLSRRLGPILPNNALKQNWGNK